MRTVNASWAMAQFFRRLKSVRFSWLVFWISFSVFVFGNLLSYAISRHQNGQPLNDGIVMAGWPFSFFEEGGFAYRRIWRMDALGLNFLIGLVTSGLAGFCTTVWRRLR